MTRWIAVTVMALAATLVPLTPAHATYGPQLPVILYVNADNGTKLARVEGTLQFDDGNAKYAYSLTLCRYSSYSAPYIRISVNGTYRDLLSWYGGTTVPWCTYSGFATVFTGDIDYGSTVRNVSFQLVGSSFSNQNVYKEHYDYLTYDNPYN